MSRARQRYEAGFCRDCGSQHLPGKSRCSSCAEKRRTKVVRPKTTRINDVCGHVERKHYARGLCIACYRAKKRATAKPASCHPDRPRFARGLCRVCYRALPEAKARERVRESKRRAAPERREYNATHNAKPEAKERQRQYFAKYYANPEVRERVRQYSAKPEVRERKRQYSAKPEAKEQVRARNATPEAKAKSTAKWHRRRARLLDLQSPGVTPEQWGDTLHEAGYRCVYCAAEGVMLTRDHIVPVARGGRDEPSNVVPACRSCNSSKNTKTAEEFDAWNLTNAKEDFQTWVRRAL